MRRPLSGSILRSPVWILVAVSVWGSAPPEYPIPSESSSQNDSRPSDARNVPVVVLAAPGEISTDRPDFTESTEVVGRGTTQLESGFTVGNEKNLSSLSAGELLLRVGVSKRVELRFGAEGFDAEWSQSENIQRGFADIELGAKFRLFDETRFLPAVSVIPILSAPAGTRVFSSGGYDPTVKLAWAKDLPSGFSLAGNVNASSLTAPEGRYHQWAYSWSLGHNLPHGFEGFWEVYGYVPWDKGQPSAWIANTGVNHKLGRNAQLDVRVGRRMTATGPDWFFGAGLALRHPGKGL